MACYEAAFSGDAFIERSTDYYNIIADNEIEAVCDLTFDIDHGQMLSNIPEFLKIESYDNHASSVVLTDTFSVSKEIPTTSSFTHDHSFSIGIEVTTEAKLPLIGGSEIKVSASYSGGISMTEDTINTVSYFRESSVEVPPGQGIMKEAIIQRATINVPWTANVVNGLGHKIIIRGTWRGVDTFNFRVEQENIDGFCPCTR